jgi:hypothetical protein
VNPAGTSCGREATDRRASSAPAIQVATAGRHGLLEDRGKRDPLESFERFSRAIDFHAQDGAFPRREQELGEIVGIEGRFDLAGGLNLGMHAAKGARHSAKIAASRSRNIALRGRLRG